MPTKILISAFGCVCLNRYLWQINYMNAMNEDLKVCQSCGMPLTMEEHFGTDADGSRNEEYCAYCYQNGSFTQECTMDDMIEHCVQFLDEFNKDSGTKYTREEAIAEMKSFFPQLTRWKGAE